MEQLPIEAQLRDLIISRYGDVKSFSTEANIPNSTISSIFKRGIRRANIGNIIALATALNISVDGLAEGEIRPVSYASDIDLLRCSLFANYEQLNREGQEKLVEISDDMVASGKYKRSTLAAARGGGIKAIPTGNADTITAKMTPSDDETL